MLEIERNSPIESGALTEFFSRCGWAEPKAALMLEWALAASEEWVACRLDGELIGFGRSCRLDPVHRVVFDALVDPRFERTGLRGEIVRALSEHAGGLEVVSVIDRHHVDPLRASSESDGEREPGYFPSAPRGAYLGKGRATPRGAS